MAESIQWAETHSIGRYCEADGRFLTWLPDDFFDAVISYAALMHLAEEDRCDVVTELIEKVRIGGRLWFGWNDPGIYQDETELQALLDNESRVPYHGEWGECFSEALRSRQRWMSGEVSVSWETIEERLLFPEDASNNYVYLYYPPAYSLFVTREPSSSK